MGKSYEHESRAHKIASGWNSKQNWIDVCFQFPFLRQLGSWRKRIDLFRFIILSLGLLIKAELPDEIRDEAAELPNEHVSALEIRMKVIWSDIQSTLTVVSARSVSIQRRLVGIAPVVTLLFVLSFHDNSVARSEDHHGCHDHIQGACGNVIVVLITHY